MSLSFSLFKILDIDIAQDDYIFVLLQFVMIYLMGVLKSRGTYFKQTPLMVL